MDLATLEEFKIYAGIRSEEGDARLTSILKSASSLIKTYCARSFVDHFNSPITEYFDGEHTTLYVREIPVREIISVSYSGDLGSNYTDYEAGVCIDRRNDTILIPYTVRGPNAVKVTYLGGYEKTPEDLLFALFDMVQYYAKMESPTKKTMGFHSIEHITTQDFPSHIKRVLDLYRVI